jgi:hypothetical protein
LLICCITSAQELFGKMKCISFHFWFDHSNFQKWI